MNIYYFLMFIVGWAVSSLVHEGFLQLWQAEATLQLECVGFSLPWLMLWSRALGHTGLAALWTCGIFPDQNPCPLCCQSKSEK